MLEDTWQWKVLSRHQHKLRWRVKGLMAFTADFQQPDEMRCTWFFQHTAGLDVVLVLAGNTHCSLVVRVSHMVLLGLIYEKNPSKGQVLTGRPQWGLVGAGAAADGRSVSVRMGSYGENMLP